MFPAWHQFGSRPLPTRANPYGGCSDKLKIECLFHKNLRTKVTNTGYLETTKALPPGGSTASQMLTLP